MGFLKKMGNNIKLNLKKRNTSFELMQPDLFKVKLNTNDLEKLDVSYILSQNELEKYSNTNVILKKVISDEGWFIYQVIYK